MHTTITSCRDLSRQAGGRRGGTPRGTLRIVTPDRTVTAEIAAKSLCKAQAAIRENGGDNIVLVLQGRLAAGDRHRRGRPCGAAQDKTVTTMTRRSFDHRLAASV
jgi:hypothetical protein